MKRNLQIRIDRAWIIVAWFVFAGLIWVPVVHGVDSSEDATRLSYGFAGYYSVTTTSDGNTTNQFDRSGVIMSVVSTGVWSALSICWWHILNRRSANERMTK